MVLLLAGLAAAGWLLPLIVKGITVQEQVQLEVVVSSRLGHMHQVRKEVQLLGSLLVNWCLLLLVLREAQQAGG
jgi:hypothetical protein